MVSSKRTRADAVLDTLAENAFADLLAELRAPANGYRCISLIDLKSGNAASIGDEDDHKSLQALTHDLLGSGNGTSVRATLASPEAPRLSLRIGDSVVLMAQDFKGAAVLPLTERLNVARVRAAGAAVDGGSSTQQQQAEFGLQRAWAIDPVARRVTESWSKAGARVAPGLAQLDLDATLGRIAGALAAGKGALSTGPWLNGAACCNGKLLREFTRVPFIPRLAIVQSLEPDMTSYRVWQTTAELAVETLRVVIGRMLKSGLKTQISPVPQSEVEFAQIVRDLRVLDEADLDQRLVLGGFADHPVPGPDGPMRCQECIYYMPHRRGCDLPELPLPVEPDWFCRLWKI